MSYEFVVRLPEHLEKAYEAGKVIVTGGVARYADGMAIAAHLEQAQPLISTATHALGNLDPYIAVANVAFQGAKVLKEMVIDTKKLNQIISLTKQIQALSTVNIAISSATLGVAVVGFGIVISQMTQLNKKLDRVTSQIQVLDNKVDALVRHELAKLTADVRLHIKNCITLVQKFSSLGWNIQLDIEASKLCNSVEEVMQLLLSKYFGRDSISVSIDLSQCLYTAYANLLHVYLTNLYLHQKDWKSLESHLETLEIFSIQLSSPDILDDLYEKYLINQERRLSERELDIILALYRCGCEHTNQMVKVHYEVLGTTSISEFERWKQLSSESKDPFIWLEHAA